jgi:hypothetical protein
MLTFLFCFSATLATVQYRRRSIKLVGADLICLVLSSRAGDGKPNVNRRPREKRVVSVR